MNKLLFIALASAGFYFAYQFCERQTDGFSLARIHSDLSYNPALQTESPTPEEQKEIDAALSQPYRYLGSGGQCFAFASEDGKYVVKFFRHRIRWPYSLYLSARPKQYGRALFKTERDMMSCKIAYESLRQETGLLYVHLNKGTGLSAVSSFTDKIGIAHAIALDDVEFVLQKKADPLFARFAAWDASHDISSAKKGVRAMMQAIVSRSQKGVFDEDPRVYCNVGFLGDEPMFIDVGRFVRDERRKESDVYAQDVKKIGARFRAWLAKAHPSLLPACEEEEDAI